MKRIVCALLALCMLLTAIPALALTGAEALGLTDVSGEGADGISTYPTLRLGSRDGDDAGAYVVVLQNRLVELGYLNSAADGAFGQATESALISFQENNQITPTGIADSTTQSVLFSDTAKRAENHVATDNEVLRVQQALARWGFMTSTPDGIEGDDTRTAVAKFKSYISSDPRYAAYTAITPAPAVTLAPEEQPLAVDVPLTDISVDGFNGEIDDLVRRFADGEYSFQVYNGTAQKGDKNEDVWRIQRRLRQLKYLYKPDGSFGSLTQLALGYFQKKNGLEETGIADEATQLKLFSSEARQAEEYVFPYKIGVSISEQRVYIYGWDGSGYNRDIGSCKCSTGQRGYDTPKGIYQSGGRCTVGEWYYFRDYNTYAKYATRIVGGVLFHSVLFGKKKGRNPTNSSVRNLGRAVSHGCVRLPVANAKWIFENCPEGTTIVIY